MENPTQNRNDPAATRLQRRNRNVEDLNQFGAVRDRLFHAMLVKLTLVYCEVVNPFFRKVFEFVSLTLALTVLSFLFFTHIMSSHASPTCINVLKGNWKNDGVVRVEVVKNLKSLDYKERWISFYKNERSRMQCHFNPKQALVHGPVAIPAEIRHGPSANITTGGSTGYNKSRVKTLLSYILNLTSNIFSFDFFDDYEEEEYTDTLDIDAEKAFLDHFLQTKTENDLPAIIYRAEYALHYGLLRLPKSYRDKRSIPFHELKIDSNHQCFGDATMIFTLNKFIGFEEAVMTGLRSLAENETTDGYLHNLNTGEHYHFVGNTMTRKSYITAAIVMFIFTFAISLLLRFSHHQIFMFIVDLLHMFELNQPLEFPAAPLLTVILALVGMEAIMSEVFADTTTAFYVILVVWIADQFDAICCHSATSKQYWLRFFFLYQFFFYAYQYRFGGQFGSIAFLASTLFIIHSMIFFFHHYEVPLILYQERVLRILSEIQSVPPMVVPPNPTNSTTQRTTQETQTAGSTGENVENNLPAMNETAQNGEGNDFIPNQDAGSGSDIENTSTEERVAENVVSDALGEQGMSLPTPHYQLNAIQRQCVYQPAEDTFLLLDAIEKDIQKLKQIEPSIVLEIGSGTGVVSTFVNKALDGKVASFATDLNINALDCTVETGKLNGVSIEVVQTDLYGGLDHLNNKVDILLFNPPYVPTEDSPKDLYELCWAGGKDGRETLDRLLPSITKLLSPKGVFYLVALHANGIEQLLNHNPNLKGSIAMERRCGIEHLYILKFVHIEKSV
ncbi:unnamed protein product [Auanema sp. JU1783]|nr:unnamed protein product [Auanema sp. JU1783]